ncbi:hypothetical protein [Niallia taxi]|uniref:hypothetical protein n=1 Tax=Niallia taxi TaxID=2499688 RepID=UPI0021A3673C|nr:hypothetical protein [Niallia taxi]MCT2347308.1 hypothetical protein [Niallia taxi]MED3965084.1 hypothetical protein [Niallia taxi]
MQMDYISALPILGLFFFNIIPLVIAAIAVVYLFKLMKERNHLLKEIARRLEKLDKD